MNPPPPCAVTPRPAPATLPARPSPALQLETPHILFPPLEFSPLPGHFPVTLAPAPPPPALFGLWPLPWTQSETGLLCRQHPGLPCDGLSGSRSPVSVQGKRAGLEREWTSGKLLEGSTAPGKQNVSIQRGRGRYGSEEEGMGSVNQAPALAVGRCRGPNYRPLPVRKGRGVGANQI